MCRKLDARMTLTALALLTLAGMGVARADCGSVPFYAPVMDSVSVATGLDDRDGPRQVEFDPLKVTVFEPKQRAIICWNGQEEVLLLSTDQRATQRAGILEVIPMPAQPTVRLGSFGTFEVAQKLVVEKNMWVCAHPGARAELAQAIKPPARITFSEKLGAHNLAVAEVLDKEHFVSYVQSYLRERYQAPETPIRPEFLNIIQSYLDEGFRWFAFDVITLDGTPRSRDPIEYRFKSDCVFYPLRISSLEGGKTAVDLLVFTANGADHFDGLDAAQFKTAPRTEVSRTEFNGLVKEWTDFFGPAALRVKMDHWQLEGDSARLVKDVRVR